MNPHNRRQFIQDVSRFSLASSALLPTFASVRAADAPKRRMTINLSVGAIGVSANQVQTIALAQSLPQGKVIFTQVHLLPYIGYRKMNFYIARPYGVRADTRPFYENPDYFLFDFQANAYPQSPEELRQMGETLKQNPRYRIAFEDHRRLLLEKTPPQ